MTGRAVTAAAAQRTLLLLTATRWFPVGLIIGLVTLLMLERGLSVSQVAIAIATQGIVMLALELPTGGLADALGRRPVLIVAGGDRASSRRVVFVLAPTFAVFVLAWALQGIFRALDSGPLEAWYVDAAHADRSHGAGGAGAGPGRHRARPGHRRRRARSPVAWSPGPPSAGPARCCCRSGWPSRSTWRTWC